MCAAGVNIKGMGYDPGNYGWVDDPINRLSYRAFTNKTFQVGAVGGGYHTHGGYVPSAYEDFIHLGGSDSDWKLMTDAGYEFNLSIPGAPWWEYKGDPACAQSPGPGNTIMVAGKSYVGRDAMRAMATCLAAKKPKGSGKGKCCCCCCCCKPRQNGNVPTPSGNAVVYSGSSSQFYSSKQEYEQIQTEQRVPIGDWAL